MATHTALYQQHKQAGARMVDFHGWQMPLHYGSQLQEHMAVRQHAGLFDISHMGIIDIKGQDACEFLRYLLANDVNRLTLPGKAQYSLMLTPQGTVLDDLIVYYLAEQHYRLIVNAACRDKDLAWLSQQARTYNVTIRARNDLCLLSLQGPNFLDALSTVLPVTQLTSITVLRPFDCVETEEVFFARTGYTGEHGIEIALPAAQAISLWQALTENDTQTIGLAARDTLRVEAGLPLYGQEMDEHTSPFCARLGWTIVFAPTDREFIGRDAVTAAQTKTSQQLLGLILRDKGLLRRGMRVSFANDGDGHITSGSYSPMLQCSIALVRAPAGQYGTAWLELHGKRIAAEVCAPAFVRHGQVLNDSLSRKVST
jgi:aminomethyltransferase